MATAVLVMDMPEDGCVDCKFWEDDICDSCYAMDEKPIDNIGERPDWCPLIPQTDDETAWYDQGYIDGWNDCLDSDGDFTKRKPWRRD